MDRLDGSIGEDRLLDAWDSGREDASLAGRVGALLALAGSHEGIATLPLGAANATLLDLRIALFGPHLVCLVDCPVCSATLELEFSAADIRSAAPAEFPDELTIAAAGERARFRLPTWEDIAALAFAPVAGDADESPGDRLLRRCLIELEREGEREIAVNGAAPAAELAAAIAATMEDADPLAELRLAVTCSDCNQSFEARLDLSEFLWTEVDARARALLEEVHVLALAYGWHEADILALTPGRRQAYLEIAINA